MRVWTVFDAMFKNSWIEAGTNKNIPCMESYADLEIVVGANRIVRQASPALNTQCPMTCSRTTGRRGGLDPIAQSSRRPTYLTQRMTYPT